MPQSHLQEGESLLDPFLEAGHLAIRRIGIQADPVAVLPPSI